MLLKKETDYAVRTLLFIAESNDEYISSSRISQSKTIPLTYLRRIISKLTKAGFLKSIEGAAGGVKLAKKPNKIKLLDVISCFQGKVEISACKFQGSVCPNRTACVLRRRLLSIDKKVNKEFNSITIQTLLDDLQK